MSSGGGSLPNSGNFGKIANFGVGNIFRILIRQHSQEEIAREQDERQRESESRRFRQCELLGSPCSEPNVIIDDQFDPCVTGLTGGLACLAPPEPTPPPPDPECIEYGDVARCT